MHHTNLILIKKKLRRNVRLCTLIKYCNFVKIVGGIEFRWFLQRNLLLSKKYCKILSIAGMSVVYVSKQKLWFSYNHLQTKNIKPEVNCFIGRIFPYHCRIHHWLMLYVCYCMIKHANGTKRKKTGENEFMRKKTFPSCRKNLILLKLNLQKCIFALICT